MESEYLEIPTDAGSLKIIFEMTIGDLVIASTLALIVIYLVLQKILSILWRR